MPPVTVWFPHSDEEVKVGTHVRLRFNRAESFVEKYSSCWQFNGLNLCLMRDFQVVTLQSVAFWQWQAKLVADFCWGVGQLFAEIQFIIHKKGNYYLLNHSVDYNLPNVNSLRNYFVPIKNLQFGNWIKTIISIRK